MAAADFKAKVDDLTSASAARLSGPVRDDMAYCPVAASASSGATSGGGEAV